MTYQKRDEKTFLGSKPLLAGQALKLGQLTPMRRHLRALFIGTGLSLLASANVFAGDEHRRHISLEGQPNFRDIGGYQSTSGTSVRWNTIYRSGELPRLTDEDVEQLSQLGIKTVVSFLSEAEIEARGENKLPSGVTEVFLPIAGHEDQDLARVVLEARQTGDFSRVPVSLNTDIHRILVGEATKGQYAELLRLVADPDNHPLVFHCSHGVHRTGTATAVLLSALGVDWESVREDYLLSNTYRLDETNHRVEALRDLAAKHQDIAPSEVDMTNIHAFYYLQGAYIDATIDEINQEYGGIDGYVMQELGINQEELTRLRSVMLDK
ncbi:tyrosine-protein phosphatase [Vibrio agarivorans]|uniref:Tyrosine-protein phosphatase n=1 Tax=Vibrio agarivorans TaxID=153622 RepID=A0ABT7Y029_9VIBR|nr:tyrosine-protein phosphatase [Vibrio agarivorans]MDN2481366.1 tyrosine-protein phosphatase [Vibrio agarivorans]